VFAAFGPDESMQLFGRGLRRRLPPMLDGDQQRIRMVYSLLFTLPGTPVLFYGEEIGMGENLDIDGRLSVRTPMQWTNHEGTAGFTTVPPSRLRRPLPGGRFGPLAVNVADQERDPDSLLNWMQRVIRRRRETPEIGWGEWTVLDAGDDAVLAHRCDWEGRCFLAVHNLSDEPRQVELRLEDEGELAVIDLLDTDGTPTPLDGGRLSTTLEGYGYRWMSLRPKERP
jgi:glycosidase